MSTIEQVTGQRATTITFDSPETVVAEQPWSYMHVGPEMCRDAASAKDTKNVELQKEGCWTLKHVPVTAQIYNRKNKSGVIPVSLFNAAATIKETNRFRKANELPGVTYDPNVQANADPFMRKSVPSTGSFGTNLNTDFAVLPPTSDEIVEVPIDRFAISKSTFAADKVLVYRFTEPGHVLSAQTVVSKIYFGGPVSPFLHGTYSVTFYGDGVAVLNEYCKEIVNGARESSPGWKKRMEFRYAATNQAGGRSFYFRISPGKSRVKSVYYLRFFCEETSTASTPNLFTSFTQIGGYSKSIIYMIPDIKYLASETKVPRPNATGAGNVRLEEPQNARNSHQISSPAYQETGVLVDDKFSTFFNMTIRTNFYLFMTCDLPDGTSIVPEMIDAATGLPITKLGTSPNSATFVPVHGHVAYYLKFTFTPNSDQSQTPALWNYTITKDGYAITTSTTPFNAKGTHFSITGIDKSPAHDSASMIIEDVANAYSVLKTRGKIPVKITTTYDSGDLTKKSVLFQGYTNKVTQLKKGRAGSIYPSPEWRTLQVDCIGVWERMKEQVSFCRFKLSNDTSVPPDPVTGATTPVKVTDAVRTMLTWTGLPLSQIDIPDSSIRFWPSGDNGQSMNVEPLTHISQWVLDAVTDYLGWYMIWDPNAGTDGMIRAIPPKVAPYTNLATFVTSGPSGKVPIRGESYGNAKWTGTSSSPANGFIRKGTFREWVVPPEANMVTVRGFSAPSKNVNGTDITPSTVGAWACNFKSVSAYCKPDGTIINSADPNDPDYLGRLVPILVVDGMLWGIESVRIACRRVYDMTCHTRSFCSFEAPLLLVTDLKDTYQTRPRPLRYYDPVYVNGVQYIVTSCNPSYKKDGVQMATYECQKPNKVYGA